MRHQQRMQYLGFFEEAVGDLTELTGDEGFLMARISKVILALPLEMEGKLRPLIGTRIGILHTDLAGNEYLVRSILEAKSMEFDEIDVVGLTKPKAQREKASA